MHIVIFIQTVFVVLEIEERNHTSSQQQLVSDHTLQSIPT